MVSSAAAASAAPAPALHERVLAYVGLGHPAARAAFAFTVANSLMLIIKPNFAFDSKGRPRNWGSAPNETRVPWWVPSVAAAAVFGLLI
eukprot:m51a1_g10613 hypothetical protein (89) ;mRNA; f:49529-49795